MANPSKRDEDIRREVIRLKCSGMGYDEIGEILHLSRQRAQQLALPSKDVLWEIRMRAKWRCEGCRSRLRNGHTHHTSTDEKTWNDPANLQYLCVGCHGHAHKGKDRKILLDVVI